MSALTRDQLLTEGVLAKFLRYVQIDSPSVESATVPSTPEQWDMAHLLEAELIQLGLRGVKVDQHAIVTATLPGNTTGAPTIGLLAHFDTYPGTPGRGVKPQVHRNYLGDVIQLPAGPVLSPETHPGLLDCIGHDIVTSDGSTLLGADDKAGVAEVMAVLCRFVADPSLPHGDIRVGFTPDEETGRGVPHFDVAGFDAVAAYTYDGGGVGEVESENFNAENLTVTITGKSAHTGTAKGAMINALHLAAEFLASIPEQARPEHTEGYEGFVHADSIVGNVEEVTLRVLLRDFTSEGLAQRREGVEKALSGLRYYYQGCTTKVEVTNGYRNMQQYVAQDPRIVAFALQAVREAGLEPVQKPIRGGTDGARLSEMGLPTPNLSTGGMNYHSRTEWASVPWMEKAVEVGVRLMGLWARSGGVR